MTPEEISKKYVHGMHDALTDRQEIKDMMTDIETYAKEYHQAKLKLLGIGGVIECLEQVNATLERHGKVEVDTDLHNKIRNTL